MAANAATILQNSIASRSLSKFGLLLPIAVLFSGISAGVKASDFSDAQKRAFATACLQQYQASMPKQQAARFCDCYAGQYTQFINIEDHIQNEKTGKMPPRMWESMRRLSMECAKNAGI